MTATTFYTLAEVAKNDGKNSSNVWMIIKNNVYDVTNYMDGHPGGRDILEEWAGKDGTKAFVDFGHSGDADSEMKNFKIGELALEDRGVKTGKKKEDKKETNAYINRSFISKITCGIIG